VGGKEVMEKVYGKPRGRAMRTAAQGLLALAVALPLVGMPGAAARAEEMMLKQEEADYSGNRFAWVFLGASLVSFGIAVNDYEESQADITRAKKAYKNYRAASTQAAALNYRDQTIHYSNRAQSYESTTNAALLLGTLFAVTAFAIFRSEGPDMSPMLLSDRGVGFTFRF
jgi:hypothetical protein